VYRARALLCRGELIDEGGLEQLADGAGATLSALALALLACFARRREALPVAVARARRALAILEDHGGIEEDEAEVFATAAVLLETVGMLREGAEVRARWAQRVSLVARGIQDRALRAQFENAQHAQFELVSASLE
jgi:hypothetical protein